ncbi:hypothetical protein KIP29_gp08 [Mycobacterium phage BabyRay]|uniref:Uncharacterized protein n=1 Tax=Mycobacterium phage BabyRay TaxID=1897486 RepID=A0A1D8EW63_9CAUD|nr:hypothetical protein KIP29_gp08 [Mycobacterium phage BabyRay]AOT25456.1 hypothetical protein SEA_BABYRAY_92 [Mycobacterium phage BabyRay]
MPFRSAFFAPRLDIAQGVDMDKQQRVYLDGKVYVCRNGNIVRVR